MNSHRNGRTEDRAARPGGGRMSARLARTKAVASLLIGTGICLGLATPAIAQNAPSAPASAAAGAPAQWNRVGYRVNSNATYTGEGRLRTMTSSGNIYLSLDDNLDGGTCVRLRPTRGPVFGPVCWAPGVYGQKTVATNVRAGTQFYVEAKKGYDRGSNSYWAGWLYY